MGVSGEPCAVEASQPIEVAIRVMGEHDFSQISVTKNGRIIGSLNEAHLFEEFVRHADLKGKAVEDIMQPAFPFIDISTPVELLSTMITPSASTSSTRRCARPSPTPSSIGRRSSGRSRRG